ncbi:NUDIX domain-containing protein [Bacillaceae bacterium SIJ1]|uniref:NUDIX hydrolase n=1 Tax=Litoribacterium kuwaitense TaxID=1398745 RepID=UPI0013EDEA6F|nr:NUDIX domain-containing protein [Litoribacterium kuwaitense]NGP44659.1 NUDIX domain-containing protein [Litoribacterium kuwaitense]
MEDEKLTVFNEQREAIGTASRECVHRDGLWHETFHCWLVYEEDGVVYIGFQQRCMEKKDYPGLYDISVAGHLLADETVEHGVREMEEELGLKVHFKELVKVGVIPEELNSKEMTDREWCHVYLYPKKADLSQFRFQKEEVSGFFWANGEHVAALWKGQNHSIQLVGAVVDEKTNQVVSCRREAGKEAFVQHSERYFAELLAGIQAIFSV